MPSLLKCKIPQFKALGSYSISLSLDNGTTFLPSEGLSLRVIANPVIAQVMPRVMLIDTQHTLSIQGFDLNP